MKSLIKLLAALVAASAVLAACQTAPVETIEMNALIKTVDFTAGEMETRTTFTAPDGDKYPVVWTSNDKEVAIFPNDLSNLQSALVEPSSDGRTARFRAAFALGTASDYQFFFVSPASAMESPGSGTQFSVTVPSDQSPSALSPDESAQILYAKSSKFDKVPDAVTFNPSHLTAYLKLTLTNVDPALGDIGFVRITSTELIAGTAKLCLDPMTLTLDAETGSKSVTAYVKNCTDVWFGLFPSLVNKTKLTVTVSGNKGSAEREVTLPDKTLFPGKVAILTVDMKTATPSDPPSPGNTYDRISEARFVTEGTQFIVATAADDLSWGMSATQSSDYRAGVAVTKSRTRAGEEEFIIDPSDEVEVLTVEAGTTEGLFSFKTKDGKYLAIDKNKNSALLSADAKSTLSDWRVRYNDGECEIRNNATNNIYYLRYRKSDNRFLAVRSSFAGNLEPLALFKRNGTGGSDWKLPPELRLAKTSLTLTQGETRPVVVALCYSLGDGAEITYSTSDASVATVSDKGVVTALKAGEATITVSSSETDNYQAGTATCQITVVPPVPVSSVTLDKTAVTIAESESGQLTASVSPANAANKNIIWTSSDPETVSVSQEGFFEGLKPGKATITASSESDPTKKATCVVTVTKFIALTGVSLDKSSIQLQKGATEKLTATVSPSGASNVRLIWNSDNTSVADVDQEGNVTAVSGTEGASCNIVVVAQSKGVEVSAKCKVTIVSAIESITLDKTELTMAPDGTYKLKATVVPEGAEITWSSSNSSVASVDEYGRVSAYQLGSATITVASASDPAKKATCAITVGKKPELKLQFAMSTTAIVWSDYVSPQKLGYSFQNYYLRLYDTANDCVVTEGVFGSEGGSNDIHTTPDQYKVDPYVGRYWHVILRSDDGFFGKTITYVNEAQGVYFVQDVMFYVDRYLSMTPYGDGTDFVPAPFVVNKSGTARLFFRHKTRERLEIVDSQYLTITCTGDQGIADVVGPEDEGFFVTVVPKKAGTTYYKIQYHHPLGIQIRDAEYIRIDVQEKYSVRSISPTGNGSEVSSVEYMYDDRLDNTNYFQLYDNVSHSYINSGTNLSVSTDDSEGFITATVNSSGQILVKAAKRSMMDRSAQISVQYKGETVATFEFKVVTPEYLVFYSKTTNFNFGNDYKMMWSTYDRISQMRDEPLYFAVYDKNHYKAVTDPLSITLEPRLCNNEKNAFLDKYFETEMIRPDGMDILKVTPRLGSAVRLNFLIKSEHDVSSGFLRLNGGRVYIPARYEILFSSDYPFQDGILSNYPHVRDERHLYLWNSDYKFYNYCYLFDAEYMEVTSSDPDVMTAKYGYYTYQNHIFHWVPYFGYYAKKAGPAVLSVRYDDGFGNTYSTDLHFTVKQ